MSNGVSYVPAGDIGVGAREISFFCGQYKRLENRFSGILTGKDSLWSCQGRQCGWSCSFRIGAKQNALRLSWSSEEVDSKLQQIMREIHEKCVTHGEEEGGAVNYVKGANIAGFLKVAEAMVAYGAV